MKITPMEGYVVLKEYIPEVKSESGLVIPDPKPNKNIGIIETSFRSPTLSKGVKVIFNYLDSIRVEDYIIIKEEGIIAIVEE